MSDTDSRKSMDDVLASIRRIVRSEKEPEEGASPGAAAKGGDMPLELTPDMRTDGSEEPASDAADAPAPETTQEESATQESTHQDDAPQEASPIAEPVADGDAADAETSAEAPHQPTMPGDGQIKEMIRDVLREEMAGDQVGETVRGIIRDELVNGEIGSNISQNVMALIQSEVAKALQK